MNERLAELLLQAAREAVEEEPTDTVAQPMVMYKKFAELIVRECANRVLSDTWSAQRIQVAKEIQEHFGVE